MPEFFRESNAKTLFLALPNRPTNDLNWRLLNNPQPPRLWKHFIAWRVTWQGAMEVRLCLQSTVLEVKLWIFFFSAESILVFKSSIKTCLRREVEILSTSPLRFLLHALMSAVWSLGPNSVWPWSPDVLHPFEAWFSLLQRLWRRIAGLWLRIPSRCGGKG